MKRKTSKFMFGVMGAMILGGAVTMQIFTRSEAKPATDLMLANIEAMAEEEHDRGVVQSIEQYVHEGSTFWVGEKECIVLGVGVNCRGVGNEWCEPSYTQWTDCR